MVGLPSVTFVNLRPPKPESLPSKTWPTIGLGPPRNSYRPKPSGDLRMKKKQLSSRQTSVPWVISSSAPAASGVRLAMT